MRRHLAAYSSVLFSTFRSYVVANQAAYTLKFVELFKVPFISFVIGEPGSGKGTQCAKIAHTFGFTHLSASDLLRTDISSNSEKGAVILETIKQGKIVPSEVTVDLIRRAIESSQNHKFLIDGFPRSEENRIAFEKIMGAEPNFGLFFDCPEEEMVKRVLCRNEGRVDDNIDTLKKRLKIFESLNLPVINYYSAKGKVHKLIIQFCFEHFKILSRSWINAVGPEVEIFEQVRPIISSYEGACK
ncbi:hypothetical protein MKX01_041622 [Papaver californicum]|nr:hypothetical protein MKX01_041622 [Papaver californicum]